MHFHMGNHLWATIFVHAGCRGFPPLSISKAFILQKKTWTKSLKHHHLIPHHDAASVHINLLCGPGLDERQWVWFNLKIINPHEMQGMPSANQTWPFSNPPWNLFHDFGGSDIGTPSKDRCHRDVRQNHRCARFHRSGLSQRVSPRSRRPSLQATLDSQAELNSQQLKHVETYVETTNSG